MGLRPPNLAAVLPTPPEAYDAQDQREARRLIEQAIQTLGTREDPVLRWVNAQDYGAVGDGVTNDSAAIQAAINDIASIVAATGADETTGGGTVFLPAADYVVDSITLKYGVRLVGAGQQATKLKARVGSTATAVILLDQGIVAYARLADLSVIGNAVVGQHGIYLHAQPISQAGVVQGGFWNSVISNVTVTGFLGEGLWLHGGDDTFTGPHQFLTLEQVEIVAFPGGAHALRLSGEVNQVRMLGPCRFDGGGAGLTPVAVLLERTCDTSGVNNGDVMPLTIDFGASTIQSATRGVTIERAQSVSFVGTHFEVLNEGIYVDVSAQNIVLSHCYVANCSDFFVTANQGSTTVSNCSFVGVTPTTHYIRVGGELRLQGSHLDPSGIRTSGVTLQLNPDATIDVTGFDTALINGPSATNITTITSSLPPGRTLTLVAHSGTIIFASGGNINFDGTVYASPLTVPTDSALHLVRFDLGGTWWPVAGQSNGTGSASAATVSTADSKAVSSGIRASTADSKAASAGSLASTANANAATASGGGSTANSKAVSDAVRISNLDSRLTSAGF